MADYDLPDFAAEVRDAISNDIAPAQTLRRLLPGFGRLLRNPAFLMESLPTARVTGPEACLYHDPDHDFVVLARGASNGKVQSTASGTAAMPHDHGPLWALYGVYEGRVRLQRYEIDASCSSEPYPGLRLVEEKNAGPGEFDSIEPHTLHLPIRVTPQAVVIVVYNKPLDSIVRRGYLADAQRLVEFQGNVPPRTLSSRLVRC